MTINDNVFPVTDWPNVIDDGIKYQELCKTLLGNDNDYNLSPLSWIETMIDEFAAGHDWDDDIDPAATYEALVLVNNTIAQIKIILGVKNETE
jgi:hypothetical protein